MPDQPPTSYGFPPLRQTDIPTCNPVSPNCSKSGICAYSLLCLSWLLISELAGFLEGFNAIHPVLPTFASPVYSNIGFDILGLALENITSTNYEEGLKESFVTKLNLSRTLVSTPPSSWGVLTSPESGWGVEIGYENPYVSHYLPQTLPVWF